MDINMDIKINRKIKSLENLISDIKSKELPLQRVILFGSFATNNFNEKSDLDLCLVYEKDKKPSCKDMVEIEAYIDSLVSHEMCVDFMYATSEQIETGSRVFNSIRREGLVLWEHSGI